MTTPPDLPIDPVDPLDAELPRALPSIPVGSPGDRLLRESLKTLRELAPDRQTRDQMTDIIEGRRSALDLLEMPGFTIIADKGVRAFDAHLQTLSPEEREQARAEGEAMLSDEDGTGPSSPRSSRSPTYPG